MVAAGFKDPDAGAHPVFGGDLIHAIEDRVKGVELCVEGFELGLLLGEKVGMLLAKQSTNRRGLEGRFHRGWRREAS